MKRPALYLILFIIQGFSFVLKAQQASIKFENTKHNFGFIREGEIINMEFTFENTGNEPLIITDSKVECGCTTVDIPEKPVMSGEKAMIKVSFDSRNKMDRQDRTVTLISNAENSPTIIRFKGVVLKSKKN